jgi:curved DNA-binding protein CbpA
LFTGTVDIYKVIGVSPSDPNDVIRKKCNEKMAKYHPDKIAPLLKKVPTEQRLKEKKRLDMQYKLVKEAYTILIDPQKRKFYDLQKKTIDSKNFSRQKQSFDDFIKLQDSEINEHSKKNAENGFKMGFLELDEKHGFNREQLKDKALEKKDFDRKMGDLLMSRELQDVECVPKKLFEGDRFDPIMFNREWEKKKRHDEKKSKVKAGDSSLVLWDDIAASNDVGLSGSSDYVSINSNYENLYSTDAHNSSIYASRLDSGSDSDDIISSGDDDIDVSYVTGHNQGKQDVMDRFKKLEEMRKKEEDDYDKRQISDGSWKSVFENPMNVSSQMGSVVGKEVKMLNGPRKQKNINKGLIDAYKQLLYDEDEK